MSNIQNILDKLEKKYPLSKSTIHKRSASLHLEIPKLDLAFPIHTTNLIYYLAGLIGRYNTDHQDNPIKITEVGQPTDPEKDGYGSMIQINHTDVPGLGEIIRRFIDIATIEDAYRAYVFMYLNEYHISSETIDTASSEFQDFEMSLKYKLPDNFKLLTSVVEEDEFNETYKMSIIFSGIMDTPEETGENIEMLENTISDVISLLHHINFQYPKTSTYL